MTSPDVKGYSVARGDTVIEVVERGLLDVPVPTIMLSANNKIEASPTRWSWSQEVERQAGDGYRDECRRLAAGGGVLRQGDAVVAGGADLAASLGVRWVIQAITIHYGQAGVRTSATPDVVYRAARAGLEKAEVLRIQAVSTYLMAVRHGSHSAPSDEMAEAMCLALLDHAAIASSLLKVSICASEPSKSPPANRFELAAHALENASKQRGGTPLERAGGQ